MNLTIEKLESTTLECVNTVTTVMVGLYTIQDCTKGPIYLNTGPFGIDVTTTVKLDVIRKNTDVILRLPLPIKDSPVHHAEFQIIDVDSQEAFVLAPRTP